MTNKYVQRAKAVILSEIGKAIPGQQNLVISVEEDGQNVSFFRRALESIEVQQALNRRGLKAELRIINPIAQAKKHMLDFLSQAGPNVRGIVFPCYKKDLDVYSKALALPEVKQAFSERNVEAQINPVDAGPTIAIATYDDVASGRLDEYF